MTRSATINFFKQRDERDVWFLMLGMGLVSCLYFYPRSVNYPYQFGKEMIGLFIPPFLTAIYLFYCFSIGTKRRFILIKAQILFFAQLIPFYSTFFETTLPYPGEDFARNLVYVNNMITNHTLWGGDQLVFDVNSRSYITQPGYRYFVLLEMLIFKNLYRFVSILNISLFITGVYYFMKAISFQVVGKKMKLLVFVIIVLTMPYAVKNILMGLSEWLAVLLVVFFFYFNLERKTKFIAFFLLGLLPFLRQNLLPPVFLILFILLVKEKKWLFYSVLFLIVVLLPVYHNLYYAHEVRFFISIFNYPFLSYTDNNLPPTGINYQLLLNNFLHYLGVHIWPDGEIDFLEEAFLFLWLFLAFYVYVITKYLKGRKLFEFIAITSSVIIPTIVLAIGFYPRFEFVVVYISIVSLFVVKLTNTQTNKG